jgi:membrane protein DedA with SNARE-associated domain
VRIPPRSILIKALVRRWDYSYPRFWVGLRLACAIWNLVLGTLLLSSGHWIGQYSWLGLISIAGSALLFATVVHLRRYLRS